jgi:hypothetical protein
MKNMKNTSVKIKYSHGQPMEIITNIHSCMKLETGINIQIHGKNFGKKLTAVTGVTEQSVTGVIVKRNVRKSILFSMSERSRSKPSLKTMSHNSVNLILHKKQCNKPINFFQFNQSSSTNTNYNQHYLNIYLCLHVISNISMTVSTE